MFRVLNAKNLAFSTLDAGALIPFFFPSEFWITIGLGTQLFSQVIYIVISA